MLYGSDTKGGVFMSALQEQAVKMINELSDDNVSFLIEVIQRLLPQKSYFSDTGDFNAEESIQAFRRLESARAEIHQYLPKDFDPDKELEEARAERYDSIG